MSTNTIARIIGTLVAIGGIASYVLTHETTLKSTASLPWFIGLAAVTIIISFVITPYITVIPYQWIRDKIRVASAGDLIAAVIGLTIGLIIAALLAIPLQYLPWFLGQVAPFFTAVIFGYLGLTGAVLRKNDIAHLIQSTWTRKKDREDERTERGKKRDHDRDKDVTFSSPMPQNQILIDTSTIIDGRIADIGQTGFITGTIVVPQFVLNELQRIADSADAMRRNRGRRGLEILNRLQKDATVPIEIIDIEVEGVPDVDSKLVKVARDQHCPIITNDFNLNRVAELQGVKVLNINELANAIKPVLLPGEDIQIRIMQDGKELGQGVGYLDDGTMIVVENGRQYMNMMIEVSVTRVLQTVAGRMIFAHPKQINNITATAPQPSIKQRPA